MYYPNLFDVNISSSDSDENIIQKITTLLDSSTTALKPGIDFSATHPWKKLIKFTNTAPRFSDVLLANPDIKAGLIDAFRWRSLDTEAKYARAFDLALSTVTTNSKLLLPDKKNIYEIAYMGGSGDARDFVFGFSPEDKTELPDWFENIQNTQNNFSSQANSGSANVASEFSLSGSEIATLL